MFLRILTPIHVLISLVAIAAGIVVVIGWIQGKESGWTKLFLWTTAATTLTGFFFPFRGLSPAFVTGVLSTIVLVWAYVARYRRHLHSFWRSIYVLNASTALYLNVFVLIVQSFQKIPALHALAPTQTELPFKIAQFFALAAFIWVVINARKKFTFTPQSALL